MPTSPELKEALKSAADRIASYVDNIATMTVETSYVELDGNPDQPKLAARSIVKLDGDSQTTLPMKKGPDGILVVDTIVNEIHQQNVQAATDYRTKMLERLLSLFNKS